MRAPDRARGLVVDVGRRVALLTLCVAGGLALAAFRAQSDRGEPVRAGTDAAARLYAPPERDGFSIVLFGDRTTGPDSGLAVLEEGVRMSNRLDPDFVLTVGDMVQGYNRPEDWLPQMRRYKAIMEELDAPWYPVVGNHDVYGDKGRAGGNLELYQEHFGPLYYSFDYRWAHFVCLFSDERLSFSNPARNQNMGAEQLAWLRADLERTRARQVFVLLHHPRWTAPYAGCNWPEVHDALKRDGRVAAVFAGHQHRWRDDGERDGIHYYVLAATGGSTGHLDDSADVQEIAHLRVRPDRFTLSVLPVGSLYGGDMVLGTEVDAMLALGDGRWSRTSGAVAMARSARRSSVVRLHVENPTDRAATFHATLPSPPGWTLTVDDPEVELAPGAAHEFVVHVDAPPFETELPSVAVDVALLYALQSGRVQPLRVAATLPIGLDEITSERGAGPNRVLVLDGKSSVRVPIDWRWNAFTLECWARAAEPPTWWGLVSKTQGSGFSLNWTAPHPQGNVRLRGHGGYVKATGNKGMDWDRWTHLALTWDGARMRLFVDGEERADVEAKGELHDNRLPLFIGADTNGRGQPEHPFTGRVDEVRVSRVARYRRAFRPEKTLDADDDTVLLLHFDEDLGGVFPDASGSNNHGWAIGTPVLAEDPR